MFRTVSLLASRVCLRSHCLWNNFGLDSSQSLPFSILHGVQVNNIEKISINIKDFWFQGLWTNIYHTRWVLRPFVLKGAYIFCSERRIIKLKLSAQKYFKWSAQRNVVLNCAKKYCSEGRIHVLKWRTRKYFEVKC